MSEEQLKAFLAKAKDDQSIQDKLKGAKTHQEVVGIAKEHGHEFTADKITELSEEELERAAGGVISDTLLASKCYTPCIPPGYA
jgi:predicted ribosomally synthesized peptide with nif11-like leader